MSQHERIEYFQWVEEFEPMQNPNEPSVDWFETYGLELQCVFFMLAFFPEHVWTETDCDGELIVSEGYHWVNRFRYFITKNPAKPNTTYEVYDDDYEPDEEECDD